MKPHARALFFALAGAALSCGGGDAPPAALDIRNETSRSCRMPVSDLRLAAQLAAPGEEPRFFDDIGCLRAFLESGQTLRPGAVAYVADHRTGNWARAATAVFSRCPSLETPMESHLVAHSDAASREQDPAFRGCAAMTNTEALGPAPPPNGGRP